MYMDAEARKAELMALNEVESGLMFKMEHDPRIIGGEKGIGSFIRKTSIDEFPQFWNVLKGEMSIVGPRPQLIEYLPLYSEEQFKRHLVKPGITGHAQINGRNNISWEKRFELDIWYVNNQSMWLDIQILFKTVGLVIKKQGICAEGEATMSRFTGNKQRRYKVINANVRRSLLRYRRLNRHFSERDIDI